MARFAPTFDMSACSPHHSHQTPPTILRPTISEVHSGWKGVKVQTQSGGATNSSNAFCKLFHSTLHFLQTTMPWSFRPTLPNFGQTKGHATNETSSACQPHRDSQFKGERLNCASWKTMENPKKIATSRSFTEIHLSVVLQLLLTLFGRPLWGSSHSQELQGLFPAMHCDVICSSIAHALHCESFLLWCERIFQGTKRKNSLTWN